MATDPYDRLSGITDRLRAAEDQADRQRLHDWPDPDVQPKTLLNLQIATRQAVRALDELLQELAHAADDDDLERREAIAEYSQMYTNPAADTRLRPCPECKAVGTIEGSQCGVCLGDRYIGMDEHIYGAAHYIDHSGHEHTCRRCT